MKYPINSFQTTNSSRLLEKRVGQRVKKASWVLGTKCKHVTAILVASSTKFTVLKTLENV